MNRRLRHYHCISGVIIHAHIRARRTLRQPGREALDFGRSAESSRDVTPLPDEIDLSWKLLCGLASSNVTTSGPPAAHTTLL